MGRFSNISLYAEMARENFICAKPLYLESKDFDKKLSSCTDEYEHHIVYEDHRPIRDNLKKSSISSIVYSAMALESYIYDYCARKLGETFSTHLDKLDTLSKYVVCLELITGQAFPKDKEPYYCLKKLISARNNLIHSKSKEFHFGNEKLLKEHLDFHYLRYEEASNAIKAMDSIAHYIDPLDDESCAMIHLCPRK